MMLVFVVFDLVSSCGVIVASACCRHLHSNLNEPLDLFPFLCGSGTKRRPVLMVNISLAFIYWVVTALHP